MGLKADTLAVLLNSRTQASLNFEQCVVCYLIKKKYFYIDFRENEMYNVSSRPYSTACVDMYKISVSPKNSSFMTCSYISRSMITFEWDYLTQHSI